MAYNTEIAEKILKTVTELQANTKRTQKFRIIGYDQHDVQDTANELINFGKLNAQVAFKYDGVEITI